MNSVKCPQCGLVNWSHDSSCKRCSVDLRSRAVAVRDAPPAMPTVEPMRALLPCPTCFAQVSVQAITCPHCGHPLRHVITPTIEMRGRCVHCGGQLVKGKKATNEGAGCLILLVGLLLAPVIIGIPIIIVGLVMMLSKETIWKCQHCKAQSR